MRVLSLVLLVALVVPVVAGRRVCARVAWVRGHAAIGICTHARVSRAPRACLGRAAIGICTHARV